MHAAGMTTRLYLSKNVLLLILSLIFQKHVLYVFFIEMFFILSPNLGSRKLAQHEMQDIHIKAARASVNQSSIVAPMSLNDNVESQKVKATFFHVLRIVMDGGSFRSSDPMSRKRSLYSVMFPDSKYTKINCGRTKATYFLNHAIAPFASKTLQDSFLGKVFGLFVDESTYHNKVDLTALRMVTVSSSLSEELQNQSLDMYPSLKCLVELILIIVPKIWSWRQVSVK